MNDHDYIDVFRLWTRVVPAELSDLEIPDKLAEAWLNDYGYAFLDENLGRILTNWVRTRKGKNQDPAGDLLYLRNYITASLRDERSVGLRRKPQVEVQRGKVS